MYETGRWPTTEDNFCIVFPPTLGLDLAKHGRRGTVPRSPQTAVLLQHPQQTGAAGL